MENPGIISTSTSTSFKDDRMKYNRDQKAFLREQYSLNRYPTLENYSTFSEILGVSKYKIRIWFKNQRRKANIKKPPRKIKPNFKKAVTAKAPKSKHRLKSVNLPGSHQSGYIPNLSSNWIGPKPSTSQSEDSSIIAKSPLKLSMPVVGSSSISAMTDLVQRNSHSSPGKFTEMKSAFLTVGEDLQANKLNTITWNSPNHKTRDQITTDTIRIPAQINSQDEVIQTGHDLPPETEIYSRIKWL